MALKQTTEPIGRTTRPTIATIAAHMGLSRATITHVLNGRAEEQRIRPETQQRVLEVARELGYRANASARAVRAGRFGNVALVQSLLGQYLPPELLYGLTTAITDKDLHLVMTQVSDSVINDDTYLPHAMRDLSADGVLISRHGAFSQVFRDRMQQLRIPAVFLNVKQEDDCVHPDDLMGGRLATEFLLQLGHERIAYVEMATPLEHYSQVDRRAGYREAMASAGRVTWGHVLPEDWHSADEPTVDQRLKSARSLLARSDRPTGVVAYELPEAMAVERAAHLLGLRVPEDLSILVFHNRIESRYSLPFLTVSNMMEEVGTQAIGMLLEKIQAPERALPVRAVTMAILGGATCMPPSRTS